MESHREGRLRLGLGSYTYAWATGIPGHPPPRPMSPLELVEVAARLGLGLVQVCDNMPLHKLLETEPADLIEGASELAVSIQPGTRGTQPDHLATYLNIATVVMQMGDTTVTCEMSYATRWEHESFPETFAFVECEEGSVELGPDFWIRVTTDEGTTAERYPPRLWPWADPAYAVVHDSIVACNANLLSALRGEGAAATTGSDNLRTVRLVHSAYASAASGRVIDCVW